jgi:hypothetical protein
MTLSERWTSPFTGGDDSAWVSLHKTSAAVVSSLDGPAPQPASGVTSKGVRQWAARDHNRAVRMVQRPVHESGDLRVRRRRRCIARTRVLSGIIFGFEAGALALLSTQAESRILLGRGSFRPAASVGLIGMRP